MNYYRHHIGDYLVETSHLTFLEDAAYSRLIRLYYYREAAFPADVVAVQRLSGARSKAEKTAVAVVLNEFFTLMDDGWHHAKLDEEIAAYQFNKETLQENGKKGGRPKSRPEPSDNQDETKAKPNNNQTLTKTKANQEPITNTSLPDGREEIYAGTSPPDKASDDENAAVAPPTAAPDPKPASKTRRGTRLPDDWQLPKSWGEWALEKRPDLSAEDVRHQAERFTDYWHAKTGKDASKADWEATWRNWIRDTKGSFQPQAGLPHLARSPPTQTAAQRRSDWSARLNAVLSGSAKPSPYVIDMGVIDANPSSF